MSRLGTRARHGLQWVLADPSALWLLSVAYIVVGLVFVHTDYTLNDEGLLTHYFASWTRQDFVPVFFFQKAKPVLCAIYLPFSAGGAHTTLSAHVMVAALAIPLIAATARALGHHLPNLAAIVVAFSPIYFLAGAAGLSNTDGVVGVSLVLYLLTARHRPLLAGLVAGLLPWVRFELGVFWLVIALHALTCKRDRAALFGMALFPVLYTAAGALYHRDPLWLAHFPPAPPFDRDDPMYNTQLIGWRYLLEPALALTPVAAAVAALRFRGLSRLERMILLYVAVAALTIQLLPMFKMANFGAAPRYSLHILPALALLLSRAVDPWWEGERLRVAGVAATLLLAAWLVTRQVDERLVMPLLIVYVVMAVTAWLGAGTLAVVQVALLAAVGPLLPVRFEIGRSVIAAYLDPMTHWIEAHPAEITGPIYTNSQLLGPFLQSRRDRPKAEVFFVPHVEMLKEGDFIIDANNDQWDRLRHLSEIDLYGKTIMASVTPADLPPGSLLALRVESRLPLLFPDAIWAPHLEVLADSPLYRIARLRPAATVARP